MLASALARVLRLFWVRRVLRCCRWLRCSRRSGLGRVRMQVGRCARRGRVCRPTFSKLLHLVLPGKNLTRYSCCVTRRGIAKALKMRGFGLRIPGRNGVDEAVVWLEKRPQLYYNAKRTFVMCNCVAGWAEKRAAETAGSKGSHPAMETIVHRHGKRGEIASRPTFDLGRFGKIRVPENGNG